MGECKSQQMLRRHLECIHCTPCASDHLPVTLYFCWAKGICGLPSNWVIAEIVMSDILCYSSQSLWYWDSCWALVFPQPRVNGHPNKPFYKLMQWGLRVGLLVAAGNILMSVTGLLAMEEVGTFSSSGSWMRGFEHLGRQNEGRGFPKEPKMSVSKLNLNGLSRSTRWLQKPWPNFP